MTFNFMHPKDHWFFCLWGKGKLSFSLESGFYTAIIVHVVSLHELVSFLSFFHLFLEIICVQLFQLN